MHKQGKSITCTDVAHLKDKLCLTVDEAGSLTNIGKHTIYGLIKAGKIKVIRVGVRRILIPRTELEKFIEEAAK